MFLDALRSAQAPEYQQCSALCYEACVSQCPSCGDACAQGCSGGDYNTGYTLGVQLASQRVVQRNALFGLGADETMVSSKCADFPDWLRAQIDAAFVVTPLACSWNKASFAAAITPFVTLWAAATGNVTATVGKAVTCACNGWKEPESPYKWMPRTLSDTPSNAVSSWQCQRDGRTPADRKNCKSPCPCGAGQSAQSVGTTACACVPSCDKSSGYYPDSGILRESCGSRGLEAQPGNPSCLRCMGVAAPFSPPQVSAEATFTPIPPARGQLTADATFNGHHPTSTFRPLRSIS